MNRTKIIDRVRKLLALATSTNKHEATSAKRRATALKKRYKIKAAEIAEVDPYRRVEVEPSGEDPYWREQLARLFADKKHCVVLRKDGRIFFEGAEADRTAHMYRNVANQIVADCQRTWLAFGGGVRGALYCVWSTTFKAEAVRAIAVRLADTAPVSSGIPSDPVQAGVVIESTQLVKAKSEAASLVDALSVATGSVEMATALTADLVGRAADLGRRFGETVYLGDTALIAGTKRKSKQTKQTVQIPPRSGSYRTGLFDDVLGDVF